MIFYKHRLNNTFRNKNQSYSDSHPNNNTNFMFARVYTAALIGLDASTVMVESNITRGLPQILIVGLPDTSINESRERVKAAIFANGYEMPTGRIVVNLAPADLRKEGAYYDLSIAISILISSGQIQPIPDNTWLIGELSLNGEIRPTQGILAIAHSAKKCGIKDIIVPYDNAKEAAFIDGINVYGAQNLSDVIDILYSDKKQKYYFPNYDFHFDRYTEYTHDVKYVKGQYQAKRALEIAAAGNHNLLLVGEPGSGKSMLAQCLPSIMPPMNKDLALEVTKIYSVAGKLKSGNEGDVVITQRPYRAPHHSILGAGLIGGGSTPKPGEITLAHHGVLFLDELAEFDKKTLDTLRQPIESGEVTISRVRFSVDYPCKFLLIAACNPSTGTRRVNSKNLIISAPLWDRFGLVVWVPPLKSDDLIGFDPQEQVSSFEIRRRVLRAWEIQQKRGISNSLLSSRDLQEHCVLSKEAKSLLEYASMELNLTGRTYDHILRVSRTIADLDLYNEIEDEHIAEAIQYRISQQSILEKANR